MSASAIAPTVGPAGKVIGHQPASGRFAARWRSADAGRAPRLLQRRPPRSAASRRRGHAPRRRLTDAPVSSRSPRASRRAHNERSHRWSTPRGHQLDQVVRRECSDHGRPQRPFSPRHWPWRLFASAAAPASSPPEQRHRAAREATSADAAAGLPQGPPGGHGGLRGRSRGDPIVGGCARPAARFARAADDGPRPHERGECGPAADLRIRYRHACGASSESASASSSSGSRPPRPSRSLP